MKPRGGCSLNGRNRERSQIGPNKLHILIAPPKYGFLCRKTLEEVGRIEPRFRRKIDRKLFILGLEKDLQIFPLSL